MEKKPLNGCVYVCVIIYVSLSNNVAVDKGPLNGCVCVCVCVLTGHCEHKRESTVVATGYQFGRCLASQMGQSFVYDCEYFGGIERPVLTPVTERVFLSLTSALKSFHCGTLTGCAGIGKSRTIADLAMVSICF